MIRKLGIFAIAVIVLGIASEAFASGYSIAAPIIQRQRIVQRQRIIARPLIQRQRIVQQVYAAPLVAQVKVKQYVAAPVYAAPVVVQPYVAVPQLQLNTGCLQGSCQLQQLEQYVPALPQCQ